ncbi:MAG TPA: hypothetical protein PKH60_00275, partial [Candidatus Woesebacteria bacterium]|nr:hypothetical protein [Candidatus Woesebacteria bacterium]
GNVGIGTTSPSALIHGIKTTEQLRLGYDASNYYSTTVSSAGGVTFDAVGISSGFTFSDYVGMAGSGLELSSTTSFSKSSGSGSFSFSTNTGNKGIEFVNSGATTGTDSGFDYSSGVTTGRGMSITANSLTSGSGIYASSSSLTSGSLMNLVVTGSGAASSSQKVLNISNSGTNGTTETTYGAYVTNTRTGEGGDTNVAGYFSASGAASNYGLIVASGNMGIGTTAPGAMLQLGTAASTLGTLRLTGNTSGYTQIQPSAAAGSWTMTLPTGTGSNGQQLTTNGSGVTSWTAANSLRTTKNILGTMDASVALDTLVNAQVYRFNYKPGMGTSDSETEYVGIMADEAPWAMHYDGTIVNPVNTLGYAILGVQALNQKNTQLENSLNQVNAMLADYPDLSIDQFGALEVFEADNATYQVVDSTTATPINDRFAAFTRTITAIIETGLTRTKELVVTGRAQIADLSVANLSINGQTLREYVVSIIQENQATNPVIVEVSPTPAPVATASESAWLAEVFQRESTTGEPIVEDLTVTDLLTTQDIDATSVTTESLNVNGQTQLGSLLVSQNASVAGVMTVNELDANSARIDALEAGMAQLDSVRATTAEFAEATISGTLYAQTIADLDRQIAALLEQPSIMDVITGNIPSPQDDYSSLYQVLGSISSTASQAAQLDQSLANLNLVEDDIVLNANAAFIDRYFKVNGIAYIGDSLGVGNTLRVGSKLEITDTYLSFSAGASTPDEAPVFFIQPSGKGMLALMGDLMILDEAGQVTINGNLYVAGNVSVEGSLLANVIEPLNPGESIKLNLGAPTAGSEASISGEIASPSGQFEVLGDAGTPVATVSAQGNASFSSLSLGRDLLERPNVAGAATESSQLTQEATQTTGRAILPAGNKELIIRNPYVRRDSLIYLTPLGSTNNQVLFVKTINAPADESIAQATDERSFTVSLDNTTATDISFTWWIVN